MWTTIQTDQPKKSNWIELENRVWWKTKKNFSLFFLSSSSLSPRLWWLFRPFSFFFSFLSDFPLCSVVYYSTFVQRDRWNHYGHRSFWKGERAREKKNDEGSCYLARISTNGWINNISREDLPPLPDPPAQGAKNFFLLLVLRSKDMIKKHKKLVFLGVAGWSVVLFKAGSLLFYSDWREGRERERKKFVSGKCEIFLLSLPSGITLSLFLYQQASYSLGSLVLQHRCRWCCSSFQSGQLAKPPGC